MSLLNFRVGRFFGATLLGATAAVFCYAQAGQPDILVLINGEKLIGHLESADAINVMFKSDLAGEVKIAWVKVNDLQSSSKFAIARKGQTFGLHDDPAKVPQGSLAVAEQKVTLSPAAGGPVVVPIADTQNVITQKSFLHAFNHPRLSEDWHGAASAGFALVQSTQKSKTFTSALSLVRSVPDEAWISPRYRTTLDFDSAYGTARSGPTTIKTNIIHASLEQDKYLSRKLFVFGDVSFDHNYSQGLDLEYTLGGGLGYVAYKDAQQELDFKGQIAYISQIFIPPATGLTKPSNHIIGAVLGETYDRSLESGITFHQELSVIPSFNSPENYSANFLANLGIPISKKFNVTIGFLDSYLNTPPAAFQRNSFQFITNLTYKIK